MTRRIFVTGGAHGIGKSIVEAFASIGDKVAFCDIDAARGEAVAAQTGATFYQADVTDAAQLEAAMQQVFDKWGDLDAWMSSYNTERTHSGKYCFGKTPMQTFIEGIAVARRYDNQQQGGNAQEGDP